MQILNVSVLQLDDDDFPPGWLGDLGGVRGSQSLVSDFRIIIWRGVVLKNNLGDSASLDAVVSAKRSVTYNRKK
jgi:hypothetical protein